MKQKPKISKKQFLRIFSKPYFLSQNKEKHCNLFQTDGLLCSDVFNCICAITLNLHTEIYVYIMKLDDINTWATVGR